MQIVHQEIKNVHEEKKTCEHFGSMIMTFQLCHLLGRSAMAMSKWSKTLPNNLVSLCQRERENFVENWHNAPQKATLHFSTTTTKNPCHCLLTQKGWARRQEHSWAYPSTGSGCQWARSCREKEQRAITWKRMSCSSRRCLFLSLQIEKGNWFRHGVCSGQIQEQPVCHWDGCWEMLDVGGPGSVGDLFP